MPVLSTCCCWKSVKSGSYACGIYSLVFYSIQFIAGTCHVQTVLNTPALLGFCLVMVILSALCVICSLILLMGLRKDNRQLLLPWTVAISMTTLIDVMVSFYLIKDAINDPFLAVLFVTDVLICALNVYALLCVLSQYQEYKTSVYGNDMTQHRHQVTAKQPPPKCQVTSSITDDVTSSNAFLLPPSPLKSSCATAGKLVYCELTTISEERTPLDSGRGVVQVPNPDSSDHASDMLPSGGVYLSPESLERNVQETVSPVQESSKS